LNHEIIQLSKIDGHRCRINFNREFRFPPGCRPLLFERILGPLFVSGPEESLAPLKTLAERAAQPR
jgi:hypothetical protein